MMWWSNRKDAAKEAESAHLQPETAPQPKVTIAGLDPRVWENPWHPLAGPPTTPQETKRFNQQVEKEQQEIQSAILQAKAQDGDIQQVANSNCADLALDWHMCMKDMSLERLTTMCAAKHVAYLNCQKLQRRNLQRLGYGRLILTDDEKDLIIGKADKMYLQEMDAERQKDA